MLKSGSVGVALFFSIEFTQLKRKIEYFYFCMGALKLTYRPEEHTPNLRVVYKSDCLNLRNPKTKEDKKLRLDYCVFGMLQPGRNIEANIYRFGMNGMMKDDEVFGATGTSYTTEFRQYVPCIGRWFSVDPIEHKDLSPYTWVTNNPMLYIDPLGADSAQRALAVVQAEKYVSKGDGTTKSYNADGSGESGS
ncbi:MAG: RHS repeat-associated core domain-containing protein, partial [Pseudomonadota bacterium]